jgi:protein-arginine kinase activator protein McsA
MPRKSAKRTRQSVCEECGATFSHSRPVARFCSAKCRFDSWDKQHPRIPREQKAGKTITESEKGE